MSDLRRTLPAIPFFWTDHVVSGRVGHGFLGPENQALAPDLSLPNHTISETSPLSFQSDVSYTGDQNGFEDSLTKLNSQEGSTCLSFLSSFPILGQL